MGFGGFLWDGEGDGEVDEGTWMMVLHRYDYRGVGSSSLCWGVDNGIVCSFAGVESVGDKEMGCGYGSHELGSSNLSCVLLLAIHLLGYLSMCSLPL